MSNLVMVMPYRAYVTKAREEGFRICAIWDPALESPEYLREVEQRADAFVLTDFADPVAFERTVRRAVRDFAADHLYHVGREDSMLATYRLAEELGVAVNPARSIELLNDKLAMRRLLDAHGVSPVRWACADRWQDVAGRLEAFELPVVVKPTRLAGSRGVFLLRHRDELPRWGELLASYGYDGPVLIEERLVGPEFSVETMSQDGRHRVLGVTEKILGPPPLFVEAGHVHPVPDSPDTRAMAEVTVRLLELAGYRCGPAHTEVIMTGAGPAIVESQARLGGDQIPRLIELSTGVDPERAIFRGLARGEPDPVTRRGVARISYFDLPRGILRSVTGLDEARELDFVASLQFPFELGDEIPETRDSKSRHGFAIVSGDSAEQALARARRVRSLVRVVVDERAPTTADAVTT